MCPVSQLELLVSDYITGMKIIILFSCIITFNLFNYSISQTITGTWELIYVAPVDGMDSEPRGITNIRFHFTDDGKLYYLLPGDSSLNGLEYVHYRFSNDTLSVKPEREDSILLVLSFSDYGTFTFSKDFSTVRTYKKLMDTSSALLPIEPKSLQLINIGDTANYSFTYDNNDYSSLPFAEKLKGTWEVIAYENIIHGDMPPYGFLNDLWTFKNDSLSVFSRIDQQNITVKYVPANEEIIVTPEDESAHILKAEFNRWGHLKLDTGNERIELKLISKSISIIPHMPLKVVLLKLNGED